MLGLSFSWKRAIGLSGFRAKIAHKTGVPTTIGGIERKVGRFVVRLLTMGVIIGVFILLKIILG